jgi:fimbrial chaperone protein
MRGPALLGLAALIAAMSAAQAASFSVLPVRVELSAGQPIAALTVRNSGSEATVVQLETMQWTQPGGKDAYLPTHELLATPPIFTIQPGASQIVRVGLRRGVDAVQELGYRLFLQEVPAAPAPDFKGLKMILRMSVPVFVAPAAAPGAVAGRLEWHAIARDGAMQLSVLNHAARHVVITHLELDAAANGKPVFQQDVQSYVLPGQVHEWTVDGGESTRTGASLHVHAASDAGAIAADLQVTSP